MRALIPLFGLLVTTASIASVQADDAKGPSYVRQVQPLLRKYCGGCHNSAEKAADLSVVGHAALMSGSPKGAIIIAGDVVHSRLLQVIDGRAEPKMPPEDEAQPTAAEIAVLKNWIAAGATDDSSDVPLHEQIQAPKSPADPHASQYITALTKFDDHSYAVAKSDRVEIASKNDGKPATVIPFPGGKINQLRLSTDGQYLLIAGGIPGVGGEVLVIDVASRTAVATVRGHVDTICSACLSPDNKWLVTTSYDRTAVVWDWRKPKLIRKLTGHNGAVYDCDIDRDNRVLATAGADQTIKLWSLADGTRLDTLGQGEGEMRCVRFTRDGSSVIGAGNDRQIRKWELLSKDAPAINPLRIARFAHEKSVTQIEFVDADRLVSLGDDQTAKLWTVTDLKPLAILTKTHDIPTGATALGSTVLISDYAGSVAESAIPAATANDAISHKAGTADRASMLGSRSQSELANAGAAPLVIEEREPNNAPAQAQTLSLPAIVKGTISASPVSSKSQNGGEADLFALDSKKGETWIMQIAAASQKSPLDSLLDIVDSDGNLVLRTWLQGVRESYFTFRGKDSTTIDDFRLHKWQEMELNELLYANGEVVKLWMYPRGPDSGFKVYPGYGSRRTLFDTTPTSHALGETTYIVREMDADEQPVANGLPLFPIYYRNDDDAQRRLGKDSRLTFTAPRDGRYFVRVRDARGFGGDGYSYELRIRRPQPDFKLNATGIDMVMPTGSGREWQVTAERIDGLEGPIEIRLDGLPDGFEADNPVIIEAGQDIALGNIYAKQNATLGTGVEKVSVKLTARAIGSDGEIVHKLEKPLTIQLKDEAEVRLKVVDWDDSSRELEELVIRPGSTIKARVIIERGDAKGPILLGKEDAGRNLPHGSFVDNIGLNGLLITEDRSEREFFITAAPWLQPHVRSFHLRSESKNNPTSRSLRLKVVTSADVPIVGK
ncbi:MAG: c-type cytochrome domain-containing protein [Pirellulales bacterium]